MAMAATHALHTPASLGYFVIGASNRRAWRQFAERVVGMQVARDDEILALRLDQHAQRFVIEASAEDDLTAVGWAFDTDQALDFAIAQVKAKGSEVKAGNAGLCATRGVERVACVNDPNGLVHELYFGPALAAMDTPFRSQVLRGGFVAGALGAGHYVAVARDKAATDSFYRNTLGLRLSDYIRGEVAPGGPILDATFLHAATGRHHSVAFACAPLAKRVHHLMVEVDNIDDVGLARDRCRAAGVPIVMDLGSHPNDGMFSFYAVTPSGFALEIGAGGVVIDDSDWQVRSYTRLSNWGHQPPPTAS